MRLWKGSLVALLTLLLALFAAATPIATAGVAAADDPLSVVQTFIDARNRGDIAGALALLADNAPYSGGPICTAANPCVGAAAHRSELERNVVIHAQVALIAPQVSGTTLQARLEIRTDPMRAAGFERIVSTLTAEVQGGKITSWRAVNDASDPMTAQYLAYQAAQPTPPSAASPAPAAASAPSAPPRTGGGGEASFIRRLGDG